MLVQALDTKLANQLGDLNRKLTASVTLSDFKQLRSSLDQYATNDSVEEKLSLKANKASVANALSRKANKQDLTEMVDAKADIADLEKICNILEQKLDHSDVEQELKPIKEHMATLNQIDKVHEALNGKASRSDLDFVM
jgi:soluble cytochrome b562